MKIKNKIALSLIAALLSISALNFTALADSTTNTTSESSTPPSAEVVKPLLDIFSDIDKTHPNYAAIMFMYDEGVIGGYPDGTFQPDKAINRAEVLKVILAGAKVEVGQEYQNYFPDVLESDWFAPFVTKAKDLGYVSGNGTDGTFTPSRQVSLAEFLKMAIEANNVDISSLAGKSAIEGMDPDAWFTPYVNYAVASGVLLDKENVDPSKELTRGEVVNMMYLLTLVRKGGDTQFLLTRAEAELAQVDVYLSVEELYLAKIASTIAVDLTGKAYANMPENEVVIGAAKLAKGYNYIVNAYALAVKGDSEKSAEWANAAIQKASEAWEANHSTEEVAKHIKEMARQILTQVGGTEL